MLAMQAAGSTDPQVYKDKVMDVANAPGEKIYPGELAKALEAARARARTIDYVGATGVELIGPGEAARQLPRCTTSRTASASRWNTSDRPPLAGPLRPGPAPGPLAQPNAPRQSAAGPGKPGKRRPQGRHT